jgi:hypothetical protein
MGHPDGAHTHGSGGGAGDVILILLAVAVVGPAAAAAAAELVHALIIAAIAVLGVAVASLVAFIAWRLRHARHEPPRVVHQVTRAQARIVQARTEPRRALEPPRQLHIHFHGLAAEDVATVIRQQQKDQ